VTASKRGTAEQIVTVAANQADSIDGSRRRDERFEERSSQAEEIVDTIEDVADQTNLLAEVRKLLTETQSDRA
jgi:methyl-accepting chemotaxis protein